MRLVLGNRTAIETPDNGETWKVLPKSKRATIIDFPDEYNVIQAMNDVVHPQGVWANHAKADTKPAWVASDAPLLADLVSDHFGGIEIRELETDDQPAIPADTTEKG